MFQLFYYDVMRLLVVVVILVIGLPLGILYNRIKDKRRTSTPMKKTLK
jgi:hypothetical protein